MSRTSAQLKTVETPRAENEEAAVNAIGQALGAEIARAPEQPPAEPGADGEVVVPAKSSGEIAIEQHCAQIARESSAQLDKAADLVMKSVKQLRDELDNIETLLLRGTAEAKTQVSNQMTLIGEVSKLTAGIRAKLPVMRNLAREVLDRQ